MAGRCSLALLVPFSASLLAPAPGTVGEAAAQTPLDPTTLTKYADPLPNPLAPEFIMPSQGTVGGVTFYEIGMAEFQQQLHSELPPTTLWGYGPPDGMGGYDVTYPGRTVLVPRPDWPTRVRWVNALGGGSHLLPVDPSVHCGEGTVDCGPDRRTVVHVHGAHVPDHSDGHPEAWFTDGFADVGPAWEREIYEYPNSQRASTIWYHDHSLGITRLNVYAGLAGFWIIRSPMDSVLRLPDGRHDIPIVIQDRAFYTDGSLFYPTDPDPPPEPGFPPPPDPSIVAEYFGNTMVVNGVIWPYLEVEPRKYRFRFLNGCNSRTLILKLSNGGTFHQIGTDGGFLEAPVPLMELVLMGAERADVIVDFSDLSVGDEVFLRNVGPDEPFKGLPVDPSVVADPQTTGQVLQFRIVPLTDPDTSLIPKRIFPIRWVGERIVAETRDLTLEEGLDEFGRLKLSLSGMRYDDPVTEEPHLYTAETWNVINLTEDAHPIHLHLVMYHIENRQPLDVAGYDSALVAFREGLGPEPVLEDFVTGPPIPPAANEQGFKDTMQALPGQVTRMTSYFDIPGDYLWHCHILEHEDHEMMRPFRVLGSPVAPIKGRPSIVMRGDECRISARGMQVVFDLPAAMSVGVRVFNVLGQEVRNLDARIYGPGHHVVRWDGRDGSGRTLPSGVYFYRVSGPGFRQAAKTVLVR